MLEPLEVTFELVTPAYAGSANKAETDGLRPPTLKALLRFWWRAMHPELRGKELFDEEAKLFGSTGTGQGLRVIPRGPWPDWDYVPPGQVVNQNEEAWHIYAAYGAVAWSGQAHAQVTQVPRVNEDQGMTLGLGLPFGLDDEAAKELQREIVQTLWLLSAFGGMGSRSRRLWGSLRITDVDWSDDLPSIHDNVAAAKDALAKGLRSIFPDGLDTAIPEELPFTAFSAGARVFLGPESTSWREAAKKVAGTYHEYRKRMGKNYGSGNAPGPDYDRFTALLAMDALPLTQDVPEGVAFGAPNNRSSRNTGGVINVGVGTDLNGRRASPLFLKVIGRSGAYRPLILWLPSQYLPDNMDLHMSKGGKSVRVDYPGDGGIEKFFTGRDDVAPDWIGVADDSDWEEVSL